MDTEDAKFQYRQDARSGYRARMIADSERKKGARETH
jgi:hypothetical protein